MMKKGTPIAGQACKVTKGPNKGKKGTYTIDEDGKVWCEGDWGGTECGSDKCEDAKSQISIFEFMDANNKLVYEIDGTIEVEGVGIFRCKALIDAATGEGRNVAAFPISATPLASLKESESEFDRRVADVIGSHVKAFVQKKG